MTRLVVVYDEGAAEPAEIHTGLSGLGEVVFALPVSPHNERLSPLLAQIGDVVPIDDMRLRRLRPDAILTFSERRIRLTAALAEALHLPGHAPITAELLTDKQAQRERLHSAGVDTTRTALLRSSADWPAACATVGLPAVLKPQIGEGSLNTHRIDASADGQRLADLLCDNGTPYVLEQYITGRDTEPHGDYVSVESAVSHGRVQHIAVTGKHSLLPPFRERGQFWPAALPEAEQEQLRALAGRAVAALGVTTGLTHTEIKLTPDGPRIIEVNGRLGGFLNELSVRSTGVNLVELAGRVALGEDVSVAPARPDAVYFQHYGPSLMTAHRSMSVRGIPDARAVEGITGYRRLMPPGTEYPESVTTRRVDHLQGNASTHAVMREAIGEALAKLTYVCEVDGETVEVAGDAEWRD